MLYPRDAAMRASYRAIQRAQRSGSVERAILDRATDAMVDPTARTARRAITAGDVLLVLYAMDKSPWRISDEPSLGKAVHAVGQFANVTRYADGVALPAGKSEIHERIEEFRPVWHLWATFRLLREFPFPGRAHSELLSTPEGLSDFFGAAAGVQAWAVQWRPRRGEPRPLLEADAYLIPPSVLPQFPGGRVAVRRPPWTHAPDWLKQTLSDYKARARS